MSVYDGREAGQAIERGLGRVASSISELAGALKIAAEAYAQDVERRGPVYQIRTEDMQEWPIKDD